MNQRKGRKYCWGTCTYKCTFIEQNPIGIFPCETGRDRTNRSKNRFIGKGWRKNDRRRTNKLDREEMCTSEGRSVPPFTRTSFLVVLHCGICVFVRKTQMTVLAKHFWWALQKQVNDPVKTVTYNLECSLTPFSFMDEWRPGTTLYMHNVVQRLAKMIASKGDPVGNQMKRQKEAPKPWLSEPWQPLLVLQQRHPHQHQHHSWQNVASLNAHSAGN